MRKEVITNINQIIDKLSDEAVMLFAERSQDIVMREQDGKLEKEVAHCYLDDEHDATSDLLEALRAYKQRMNRYATAYTYEDEEHLQNPYATKAQNPYAGPWTCPNCGTLNPQEQHMCSGCGSRIHY